MPRSGENPLKNGQHERYAVARASGMLKKDAYYAAGYTSKSYNQVTHLMDRRGEVVDRIAFLQKKVADQVVAQSVTSINVTRNQLNLESQEVYRRAMEGSPVLSKDGSISMVTGEDGTETELRRPDLAAANAAIMGRAKINGLAVDVNANVENFDASLEGKSPDELKAYVLSLLEQVDPNMHKKLRAQVDAEAAVIEIPPGASVQ